MRPLTCCLLVAVAACGGSADSPGPAPAPVPPVITLAVSPAAVSIVAGQPSPTLTVTLSRNATATATVNLSVQGLPAGLRASFNPSQLTRTTLVSSLDLQATASAPPGNATVTVRAEGAGNLSASTTFALTVRPAS